MQTLELNVYKYFQHYNFLACILLISFFSSYYGFSPGGHNSTCFNTSTLFNCTDGHYCIPIAQRCNYAKDCRDGSDETNCNMNSSTPFCTTGFQWSQLGCVDIDECQELLSCSQICVNTPGSFTCSCVQGYSLDTRTGTFCKATGPLPNILVTAGDDIFTLYPESNSETITYFTRFYKYHYIRQLQDVNAISFHYRKGLVFWSDASKHALYMDSLSQTPSSTNPYILIFPLIQDVRMRPVSLAVDWLSDKLYWADDLNGRIEVSGLDGTNRRVLISGLVGPRSLALDPEWGYLFFSICDPSDAKVLRSDMDGSNIITLHNTSLLSPNALTIDLPTHTLYWTDSGLGRIERSDVNGMNRHVVLSDRNLIRSPSSMSVYEDTIYISDTFIRGVLAIHKDGSWHRQIARRINKALSLQIVSPSAQPDIAHSHPCFLDNGGCSHLCLLSNTSSHSCLCPTLRTPSYNARLETFTCSYPSRFMLATTGTSIRAISLQASNCVDAQLDIATAANITGLVWDDLTTSLFWSSGLNGCIYRYQLGSRAKESRVLFQDKLIRLTDIAFDWIHYLLYFIDETNKRIEVISVRNPNLRSVVVPHGLYRPRGIVVNPIRGYIAWIDTHASRAAIMTAGMDGSNPKVLVSLKLLEPVILTIDYMSDYLYWYDMGSGRVEKVFFDGTRRRVVMSTQYTLSTLSVYNDQIFWCTHELDKIFRYNPSTRSNTTILTGLPHVSHLSAYYQKSELSASFDSSCHSPWVNCSHICVLRGSYNNHTIPICMCKNGFELTNTLQCNGTVRLYAALLRDNDLYYSVIQSSSLRTLLRIRASNITSIALDPTDANILFYAENPPSGCVIKKVIFDRESHTVASTTVLYSHRLGSVIDIAIDPRTQLLYWLDSQNGIIEVGTVSGDKRTIILGQGLSDPKFILLDVDSNKLYWVEVSKSGSFINSIDLDGSNKQKFKSLPHEELTSLAIATLKLDGEQVRYMLWTTRSSRNIYCYEIELEFVYFVPSPSSSPRSLTVHGSEIFWRDSDANTIYTATLNPGNPPYIRKTRNIYNTEYPLSAVEIESYVNKIYSTTPCSQDTTCSYLCLPRSHPPGYSCHCPTGIVPQTDSHCPLLPSRFLLISLHSEIHCLSLDTSYRFPALLYHQDKLVIGAADAYAPRGASPSVIWSDITRKNSWAIWKMDIATQTVTVLVSGVFTRGLAVDQTSGNLFYTDRFNRSIMEYNLETNTVRRLVTNETSHSVLKPRSLAIDPSEGYLFWTDWGLGTLERSRLDGSERKLLITHSILEPSGLTIDSARQRLYWIDYAYKTIESCDYDGLSRFRVAHNLSQPYSITLDYPNLYFTDWTNNTLNQISLLHSTPAYNTTYQSKSIIMDVQFIDIVRSSDPCDSDNCDKTDTPNSASTQSTTSQSYSTTSYTQLHSYPQEHLFTILYILSALLLILILVLIIILMMLYCNHRKLRRRQGFSPHSDLTLSPPANLTFADAIFSLTNNSPSPQQESPSHVGSPQRPIRPFSSSNIQRTNTSYVPLQPTVSPDHTNSHEEASPNSTPFLTPITPAPNPVISHDYTPKRSIGRGKVRHKLFSKFQENTNEFYLTTPLSSFKYGSLSPSKKNSSVYNSSCF